MLFLVRYWKPFKKIINTHFCFDYADFCRGHNIPKSHPYSGTTHCSKSSDVLQSFIFSCCIIIIFMLSLRLVEPVKLRWMRRKTESLMRWMPQRQQWRRASSLGEELLCWGASQSWRRWLELMRISRLVRIWSPFYFISLRANIISPRTNDLKSKFRFLGTILFKITLPFGND